MDDAKSLARRDEYTEARNKAVEDMLDIIQDSLSRSGAVEAWVDVEQRVRDVIMGLG